MTPGLIRGVISSSRLEGQQQKSRSHGGRMWRVAKNLTLIRLHLSTWRPDGRQHELRSLVGKVYPSIWVVKEYSLVKGRRGMASVLVRGIQFTDDDHLLLVVVVVHGRVDHPQAAFVHRKVDVGVAPPLPGGGVLVDHVVELRPGRHVSHPQIVLDDVLGEGPVVVEGSVVNHVACAYPVVRQFE
ncbi:hypothetical protein EYF80_051577 [Liparis tanakae]|uniref:Uncharacterized protein n=1 Tax=Liparis tanakae TaxID=230148 RepID=A0A4Z2FBT9_9TELE|nr:hypothetical protein EYF80_051577 [Liparis tanakae]